MTEFYFSVRTVFLIAKICLFSSSVCSAVLQQQFVVLEFVNAERGTRGQCLCRALQRLLIVLSDRQH